MPIYDYKCQRCGMEFWKGRPMKESSFPAKCPECEGMARRIYNHIKKIAIIFKGSGFYTTDNKK